MFTLHLLITHVKLFSFVLYVYHHISKQDMLKGQCKTIYYGQFKTVLAQRLGTR